MDLKRIKNKLIAKLLTRFPSLSKKFTDSYEAQSSQDIPWTPTTKPLSDATIAIVTTAGVHHKDQTPFDMKDQDGDPSFREIDITKPLNDLMITHDYYDHADADKDINIVFPVERLIEFAQEKIIGSVAKIHYGFMGHILGRHIPTLVHTVAPQVAKKLKDAHVDIVLLVPGWGTCNQSVGLIQREIEKQDIPTIGISIVRKYSEQVKPPRTVFLRWPFGHPLGEPFNTHQQRVVLAEAFRALYEIREPGTIIDLPYRWKRETYGNRSVKDLLTFR